MIRYKWIIIGRKRVMLELRDEDSIVHFTSQEAAELEGVENGN